MPYAREMADLYLRIREQHDYVLEMIAKGPESGGEFWTAGAGRYSRAHNKGPTHDTLASINSHRKSRVRTRRRPSASAGQDLPERGSGLRQGGAPQHARQCLEGLQARAAAGDQGRDHGEARGD